jgi:hypothetical protein
MAVLVVLKVQLRRSRVLRQRNALRLATTTTTTTTTTQVAEGLSAKETPLKTLPSIQVDVALQAKCTQYCKTILKYSVRVLLRMQQFHQMNVKC